MLLMKTVFTHTSMRRGSSVRPLTRTISIVFWIFLAGYGTVLLSSLVCRHHLDQRFNFVTAASLILIFVISSKLILSRRSLSHAKKNLDEAQQLAGIGSWERNLGNGKGYWSENHYRLFGMVPRQSAPSMDEFFALIHPDDREHARATVIKAIETGSTYEIMYRQANDRENRMFRSSGTVQCDENGTPLRIVGSIQNITERYHQQCLREQLLKQKELFITRLSHDLKTPLTPLMALLPLIRRSSADAVQQEMVDLCLNSANHIMELVLKTTRLSQLSSSTHLQPKCADIPLATAVDGCIAEIRRHQPDNLIIENMIDSKLSAHANLLELEEIFQNLIDNAIKFSPLDCRITIDAFRRELMVTICVKDNGIGLAKEELTDIFDEFFKADQSRHELNSSGLGLSICRRIVENHGGCIWAQSSGSGHGTTICFTLASGGAYEE